MRRFSENRVEAPVTLRRILATIAFLTAALFLSSEKVSSQTTGSDELVAEMAAQQKLISIFGRLDYQIRQHFLLEANAILSTYGDWNSISRLGNNASVFRDSKADFEHEIIIIRRDIGRNSAITEGEMQTFDGAIEIYEGLIEAGDQIAKALDDGRVNDANQIYFEIARPNYLLAHGTMYTLIVTTERRVAAMARTRRN
jgi:hypothetical protein